MNISKALLFSLFLCGMVLSGNPVSAQYDPYPAQPYREPYRGMHTLKSKIPPPARTEKAETETPKTEDENPSSLPQYKLLSSKDSLVKPDDLEAWTHIDDAALATTDKDIKDLIYIIESDRGAVPPQGLFFAAKSLADKGLMEQAATYFLVGQLRLEYDIARWPSTPNKNDIAERDRDSKKSPDQVLPNTNKKIRMDNPHSGVKSLGDQMGAPIISWLIKNPDRMDKAIKAAKAWDASATYAYLPNYELTAPVPFSKWEKLLIKTRETYFAKMMNWAKLMNKSRG